jgi:phage terminase large subunit-like protein
VGAAVDLLAGLVLEDGRKWGEVAEPWQWEDARAVLEPGRSGPRLHFLTRPRSGSKTTDLAAVCCAALVEQVPPGGRCYSFAADKDQARLLVDALAGLVGRTPGLSGAVRVERYVASTPSGAALEVLASDAPSAYGLRAHLFVVDELPLWPSEQRAVWTAIVSAQPKVPGARLVCLGSAGDPAHWSFWVRERARVSDRWRLHEVAGPVPWVDAADLVEQRALLTDSQFARLHLNRWTASEDRLVSVENLAAAVTLDGPQDYRPGSRPYRMGVDLGLRHDRTAIAVCHAEPVGGGRLVVLDRLVVFEGSPADEVSLGEVEAAILECWRAFGRPRVRLDPWQAIGLAQRLRQRGMRVEEFAYTAQRYGAMASVLFALLRDGLLALYGDEALLDELANVRLKETLPGQVRVDHDPGRHDDMAVALGMAATALVERPTGGPRLHIPTGVIPRPRLVPVPEPGGGIVEVRRSARKPPAPMDRIGQLIPADLRARRREAYRPPGSWQ